MKKIFNWIMSRPEELFLGAIPVLALVSIFVNVSNPFLSGAILGVNSILFSNKKSSRFYHLFGIFLLLIGIVSFFLWGQECLLYYKQVWIIFMGGTGGMMIGVFVKDRIKEHNEEKEKRKQSEERKKILRRYVEQGYMPIYCDSKKQLLGFVEKKEYTKFVQENLKKFEE